MSIDSKTALAQIDALLQRRKEIGEQVSLVRISELTTLYFAAIRRLTPPGSPYLELAEKALTEKDQPYLLPGEPAFEKVEGVLHALRADYEAGRMEGFRELVHADLFSDFLAMAEYLLADENLKDPAAVLAGGVLEEHLRKMCAKHHVPLPARPKLDAMNAELAKKGVYGKNEQKLVTAWAGIRNDAAHANFGGYNHQQVALMIQGIRDFTSRFPA